MLFELSGAQEKTHVSYEHIVRGEPLNAISYSGTMQCSRAQRVGTYSYPSQYNPSINRHSPGRSTRTILVVLSVGSGCYMIRAFNVCPFTTQALNLRLGPRSNAPQKKSQYLGTTGYQEQPVVGAIWALHILILCLLCLFSKNGCVGAISKHNILTNYLCKFKILWWSLAVCKPPYSSFK